MNRLFGSGNKAPKPSLNSAISSVDERIASIDVKLAALNSELAAYQGRLARMGEGAGKALVRQRATRVLQRRRAYEAQREALQGQVWGLEQAGLLQDGAQQAAVTVEAMRATHRELRREHGRLLGDAAAVDRLQDELAELADAARDVNDALARSYDVPDDVDEADLDAELDALGADADLATDFAAQDALPAFMQDEVPDFIDEPPHVEAGKAFKEAAG